MTTDPDTSTDTVPPARGTVAPTRATPRQVGGFVVTTAAALAAAAVLRTVDPHEGGHYPTCPFLSLTGLYCPGCGSLRALHDLLHLDVVGALARNPLALLGVVALVVAWACWGLRLLGRDAPHPTRVPARWVWGLAVAVVAYAVLRNVPGWTWLSPA